MKLSKRYNPRTREPEIQADWQDAELYFFNRMSDAPIYSIDTPPPTVSGNLHMGHVFSYSHADFIARYQRMNGRNVFYPMGFDDNGLPTGKLVEKQFNIKAQDIDRDEFIDKCLEIGRKSIAEYKRVWSRLGLSIDWRYTYRTIDQNSQKIAQWSFIDLYHKGLVYRQKAPTTWCPDCQTAIAQADLDDLERQSVFYTIAFQLENGDQLPIATTRPELLPACVAIFVHPDDPRFQHLIGSKVFVPLFGQTVTLLADHDANPDKGTGVVMCCTFGDAADVSWWRSHDLPLVEAITPQGIMTRAAGQFQNIPVREARGKIVQELSSNGLLIGKEALTQSVRVHERCDTPVEFILTNQWFIRILDFKTEFLAAGERIDWYPAQMKTRYQQWVENLNWDWVISRQRYFGVPFPVWFCEHCSEIILPEQSALPVDPQKTRPTNPCPACGSVDFRPEKDVMDTWATSSLSPQIVGRWPGDPDFYQKVHPFSLRPQAHEIIRTWAFYTIVKSHLHFQSIPWKRIVISGWGLAPAGKEKLSKSRGGGSDPLETMEIYSADAVRYWAASIALGKDARIDETRIQAGAKLVTKLWNVARFSQRFLENYRPPLRSGEKIHLLTPADRWILTRVNMLIERCTELWESNDYASAKAEVEGFFWRDLADNYLEMIKKRLYDGENDEGARYALYRSLSVTIKLFAPIIPHVTDFIYQSLFAVEEKNGSIHLAPWPTVDNLLNDHSAVKIGQLLQSIATTVRRYKSENNLSLAAEIETLILVIEDPEWQIILDNSIVDLLSITRARTIRICSIYDHPQDFYGEIEHLKLVIRS